jgi:methyl-accepting chemotaxis protein
MYYNPFPARVWSRVQNKCTYVDEDSLYNEAYIPLTGQTLTLADAKDEMQMFYKGNILQHKGNSARLTKSQRYSQLARMAGPNRTKVFATQTTTYTNPNTSGLLRVGYSEYNFPNQISGAANNISGPFNYGTPNPNGCPETVIKEGGQLVCGTYADPCSGEIYKQEAPNSTIYNLSSASDVPGNSVLSWNTKIQTWFPRQKYKMNNSGDKWPINYKGFIRAMQPGKPCPPIVTIQRYEVSAKTLDDLFINNYMDNKDIEEQLGISADFYGIYKEKNKDVVAKELYDLYITWVSTDIYPIASFNIYVDDVFYANVKNDYTYSYIVRGVTKTTVNISVRSLREPLTTGTTTVTLESDLGNANQTIFVPPEDGGPVYDVSAPVVNKDDAFCDLVPLNNLLEKIQADIRTLDNVVTVSNELINYKLDHIDMSMNVLFNDIDTSITQTSEQLTLNVDNKFTDLSSTVNNRFDGLDTVVINTTQEIMNNINSKYESLDSSMNNGFDTLGKSLADCCQQMGINMNDLFKTLDASLNTYNYDTIESISILLDEQLYNITNEFDDKLLPIADSIATVSDNVNTISGKVDTVTSKVDTISDKVDTISTNVTTISGKVDTVTGKVDTISTNVTTVSDNVTTISGKVDTISTDVTAISGKVDTVSGKVDTVSGKVDTISTNVTTISGKVDTISTDVTTVSDNVTTISGKVDTISTDVTAISDKVETISDKVETISTDVTAISDKVETISDSVYAISTDVTAISDSVTAISDKVDTISDSVTAISDSVTAISDNVTLISDSVTLISDSVTTISSSITDVISIASSILNKVLTLNNCDCSGCCCCGCSDSSCNCDVYNTLFQSSAITTINEYVMSFISTIYEDTDTYIPIDEFDSLNASLVSLEDLFVSDPSCCFVNVIDVYRNMLKIVKSAFDKKNLAKTTLINAENWRQDSVILRDPTKLSEYIEALNKSYRIMDLGITSSKAMIKPQYKIYHELYGIPPNLAYDPHLMKPILDSLQML